MNTDNFTVIVLGIVYHKGKVLIGRRKEKDEHIEQLTWVFPGGRPRHEELDIAAKREVKEETGLSVNSIKLLFARTYPEKRNLLSLFYLCEVDNNNATAGGDLAELKWVRPTEVKDYFTTSIHPNIFKFLQDLENEK